jgi:phytoene synthase
MEAVYAKTLRETEKIGWRPPRIRVKISKPELLWTVVRLSLTR